MGPAYLYLAKIVVVAVVVVVVVAAAALSLSQLLMPADEWAAADEGAADAAGAQQDLTHCELCY